MATIVNLPPENTSEPETPPAPEKAASPSIEYEEPQSVEEAGALLGAAITRVANDGPLTTIAPPKGMHSSFSALSPVPSSELFSRLSTLRDMLEAHKGGPPLIAAPSLLAVLMKLLGVSTSMAASNATAATVDGHRRRRLTPPMLSNPLRSLWVDCVVLCHVIGEGLTGSARMDVYNIFRKMTALISLNPRSAKAAGGTRIAALQVIGKLFENLPAKLAPWAFDVLSVCHKALKSSGSGDPYHRMVAVQTATSAAYACCVSTTARNSSNGSGVNGTFLVQGAMEEKTLQEAVRLLKRATDDKFPEVRSAATAFACALAPQLIQSNSRRSQGGNETQQSPTAFLDDVLQLAMKNLDDESAHTASGWAEALARCFSAAIEYEQTRKASSSASARNVEEDEHTGSSKPKSESRKTAGSLCSCSSLQSAVKFLVDHFIKVGGELSASRGGGSFSTGGRAPRVGISMAMMNILKIQSAEGTIGPSGTMSHKEAVMMVLQMLGPDLEKQLKTSSLLSQTSSSEILDGASSYDSIAEKPVSIFALNRVSNSDPGLAVLSACRVIRRGLSEFASEPTQLNILNQLSLLCSASTVTRTESGTAESLNPYQLQAVLVEISHLVSALGEAATFALGELLPAIKACLEHPSTGVRHEAAIVCVSLASPFPTECRRLIKTSINEIQSYHVEIMSLAQEISSKKETLVPKRRFLGKSTSLDTSPKDKSFRHQYAIHGHALMISLLFRELPNLPGGLPVELLDAAMGMAEILVLCQYNEILSRANPGGACTCIRAGYGMITGALKMGPKAISPHISQIFGLWNRSGKRAEVATKHFSPDQDLICLEAALSSIVAFLGSCSDLLLAVPEALSRITILLEKVFPLFLPEGRLSVVPSNLAAISSFESAKSFLMDAFSWLPPGSFPMVADQLFTFAANHIQEATEKEIACSILTALVNKQDRLLDAESLSRVHEAAQAGGARDIEDIIVSLTSESTNFGEREAAIHFMSTRETKGKKITEVSPVLQHVLGGDESAEPPTPLHKIGTWRAPLPPPSSAKIRLVDSAIQAFAASFGLKDGHEQQNAMIMLESLLPASLVQLSRAFGVSSGLMPESDRRTRSKQEGTASSNITATVLACLQALPLQEVSNDTPIGIGPPWMKKAKNLLLTLVPSSSNLVRRAVAEGLSLLAALGVKEDAHTLQSAVLYQLDEVMQGNAPGRFPIESISCARAGSLHTLACIQRTAQKVSNLNGSSAQAWSPNNEGNDMGPPTRIMMTRVLPSLEAHLNDNVSSLVKTYALHSFGLLLVHSIDKESLGREDLHLLRKAAEAVEDNFLASWTCVSPDYDKGQESEKFSAEASFLCVMLRVMTMLCPHLNVLAEGDPSIQQRFTRMASVIMKSFSSHPSVVIEALSLFERLSSHATVETKRGKASSFHSLIASAIKPAMPSALPEITTLHLPGCVASIDRSRASVLCATLLNYPWSQTELRSVVVKLFALLETISGSRHCLSVKYHRTISVPREYIELGGDSEKLEVEILNAIDSLLRPLIEQDRRWALHWMLFSRSLILGSSPTEGSGNESTGVRLTVADLVRSAQILATSDAADVSVYASPPRWQVKCQAVSIADNSLAATLKMCGSTPPATSPFFNPIKAHEACVQECRDFRQTSDVASAFPPSYPALHLEEIVTVACTTSVATVEQSELVTLQNGAARFLATVIKCFADSVDEEIGASHGSSQSHVSILEQYKSQLFSSIKHALSFAEQSHLDGSHFLFISGCEALVLAARKGLITDAGLFKRLSAFVIPSDSEMQFSNFPDDPKFNVFRLEGQSAPVNTRSLLLVRVSKLMTIARLRMTIDAGLLEQNVFTPFIQAVEMKEPEIAVHSAACSLDGGRLLSSRGVSLYEHRVDKAKLSRVQSIAGITYSHINGLDEDTRVGLEQAWPTLASSAVAAMVKLLDSQELDESRRRGLRMWMGKIAPLLFSGVHDVLGARSRLDALPFIMSQEDTLCSCITGIRATTKSMVGDLPSGIDSEINATIVTIANRILYPVLGIFEKNITDDDNSEMPEQIISNVVVEQACGLLQDIPFSPLLTEDLTRSLTNAVLIPLSAIQDQKITLDNANATGIIVACLRCVSGLVSLDKAPELLLKAIVKLCLDMLSDKSMKDDINGSASGLLLACLQSKKVSKTEQRIVVRNLAQNENWDAWATICSDREDSTDLFFSLGQVKTVLLKFENANQSLVVLDALRTVLQQWSQIPGSRVGIIFNNVGPEVLFLLKVHGCHAHLDSMYIVDGKLRITACADALKIVMIAFQHLISRDPPRTSEQLVSFLTLSFEVLIALIEYNGLPNADSTNQNGADPVLGRMSAQAATHIARTAPAAFKGTMAMLSAKHRSVLETAVRAELSGYPDSRTALAVKKKLSLKGFRKSS